MGNMHVTLFIVFPLTQMHDFSENLQVFLGVYGFQAYGFLGKMFQTEKQCDHMLGMHVCMSNLENSLVSQHFCVLRR